MLSSGKRYLEEVESTLRQTLETQEQALSQAAKMIAEEIRGNKLVYIFGTGGHCNRAAEEMFWRSGGLASVAPILDAGLALIHGATRATKTERMQGYAKSVLDYYGLSKGDLLIIVNAYGINSLSIDTALECQARGIKTIAVTSFEFPKSVPQDHPARHSSGKNLFEIVDLAINNFVPAGDAVVEIEGFQYKVAAISTMVDVFILNVLVCQVVEELVAMDVKPPVWISANAVGGDAWNKELLSAYMGRIRHL